MTVRPWARLGIDELDAFGGKSCQIGADVRRAVGDMVKAGPTALEEATHGRFRTKGLEEFDGAAEGDAHSLRLEGFGPGGLGPGEELEEACGVFQRGNGDGHVVQGQLADGHFVHRRPAQ